MKDYIAYNLENFGSEIVYNFANVFGGALKFMTATIEGNANTDILKCAGILKSIAHRLNQIAEDANTLWKMLEGDQNTPFEKEKAVVREGERTLEWAIAEARGELSIRLSAVWNEVSVLASCIRTELSTQGQGKERDDACIAGYAKSTRRIASIMSANLFIYAEVLERETK